MTGVEVRLWGLRAALLGGLVLLCATFSPRHWDRRGPAFSGCLARPAACIGQRFETDRWLVVAGRDRSGRAHVLEVDGARFHTTSALEGVRRGDILEASLTVTARDRIEIHSFVRLRPGMLTLRVWLSVAASVVALGLLWRRRSTRTGKVG